MSTNTQSGAVTQPPVSKGLQTWIGYGSAAAGVAGVILLAVLQAADAGSINLPPWLYGLLLAGSMALTAITGRNRSEQAVANAYAGMQPALPAAIPAVGADPLDPTDEVPVERTDADPL